jgi:replicative DNA helicase
MSDELFQPPADVEAEEALIGAILIDPEMMTGLTVAPNDFFIKRHSMIWEAIQALAARNDGIDVVTVQSELGTARLNEIGGAACLTKLVTHCNTAYNAPTYAARVKERARDRALIQSSSELAQAAYKGDADKARKVLERAQEIAASGHAVDTLEPVSQIAGRVWDWVSDPEAARRSVLSLGLGAVGEKVGAIDRALGGGLDVKTLTVLMARPAMGKTAALAQIADEVSKAGRVVAFFSKEMTCDQIVRRMAARRARVNLLAYRQGKGTPDEQGRLASETANLMNSTTFFIDDSTPQTTAEMQAKCYELKRRLGRLDLVIADHLRLFADEADNETHRLGRISWGLKRVAKELDTRVLAAAQLSRQVEGQADKRPDLKDLRDSGEIEENADNVIALYRESYYNPKADKVTEFIIAKARDGQRGAVAKLSFVESLMSFEALAVQ